MIKKYLMLHICFSFMLFTWAAQHDFEKAKKAYENGRYTIAKVYLEHILNEEPQSQFIPDVYYYLIKIYDQRGDFVKFNFYTNLFLKKYLYHVRTKEVFNLFLTKLLNYKAYGVALDYVRSYDYLEADTSVLIKIGFGLFEQNRKSLADYMFSLCPQSDTVKILRAAVTSDFSKKRDFYERVDGVKGKIYLTELLLQHGDTIAAYDVYRVIGENSVEKNMLYRYTKLSELFDGEKFMKLCRRLRKLKGFENKAFLLEARNSGVLEKMIVPTDREECVLFIEYLERDSVSRVLPDTVNIDSILLDSLREEYIESLREKFGGNFYLDSVYAELLLNDKKIDEAFSIIKPYFKYQNTVNYVREIRALKNYNQKKFDLVARDIILSNSTGNKMKLLLANSLLKIGRRADYLFRQIIQMSKDTVIVSQAIRQLLILNFENGEYHEVIKHPFDVIQTDTNLVRYYIYSLAHKGKIETADSIHGIYFGDKDYDFLNHYGEYLIDKKKYKKALAYYDSIISSAENNLPARFYYNWALIPFLKGEIDTALDRFTTYIDRIKGSGDYHKTLFKIATVNYLKQAFDTAAYYYSLASEDDSLRDDAWQNQLICYKKLGRWHKVIEIAMKILPFVSDVDESEVRFEIAYAFLRSGNAKKAIEYLKMAIKLQSTPEFLYWFGEAYLAKGDFVRALYQYQKIVDLFPEDKMWTPTAYYKMGIVYEFMDELDEAKHIYKYMVRKYGIGDTWGVEAQKRLEELK